ncbi:MAG: hypothetical protein KUG77_24720, partial [Nannocystaceae bacterium]|nr:hypothetical protein [Nannocystaceae bacterium]
MSHTLAMLRFELRAIAARPMFWVFVLATLAYKTWEVVGLVHEPYGPVLHNAPTNIELRTLFTMLYVVNLLVLPWLAARVATERFDGTRAWIDQCAALARPRRLARWLAIVIAASVVAGSGTVVMRWLPPLLQPDPYAFGPFVPGSAAKAWVLYAVITVASFSGIFMWLGERVRTPSTLYGFGVLFVALWVVVRGLVPLTDPGTVGHAIYALLDPFGAVASTTEVAAWTPEQFNTLPTPLGPLLVGNRALWLTIGVWAWWRAPRQGPAKSRTPKRQRSSGLPIPIARHLRSWAWRVSAIVMVVASGSTVRSVRRFAHTYPTTDVLVHDITPVLLVVALAWVTVASVRVFCLHDRLRTDAWIRTAHGSAVRSALKEAGAIAVTTVMLFGVPLLALPLFQGLSTLGTPFSVDTPWLYPVDLFGLQLPGVLQRSVFIVAAAMATRKPGAALLAALLPTLCDQLALLADVHSRLVRPGMNIDLDYSFMAGFERLLAGHVSYTVHWTIAAALALVFGLSRWSTWARQPSPHLRMWAIGLAAAWAASHGWILYNTAVLNPASPPTLAETMAEYERAWGSIRDMPQPIFSGGEYRVCL